MRINHWVFAGLLATSGAAHALNTQAPAPPRAGTGQTVEDAEVIRKQGTITKVDWANQTVFIDGVAYRYHEFGTHRHDPRRAGVKPAGDPTPGTAVEFVARRERSFDKPRIVHLQALDTQTNGK
jgi:hypothetical protein